MCEKSLKSVGLEMWCDEKNRSFYEEFIWNNTLLKGMSISVQNYKIMPLPGLPF
jgi:hypothetical protein